MKINRDKVPPNHVERRLLDVDLNRVRKSKYVPRVGSTEWLAELEAALSLVRGLAERAARKDQMIGWLLNSAAHRIIQARDYELA